MMSNIGKVPQVCNLVLLLLLLLLLFAVHLKKSLDKVCFVLFVTGSRFLKMKVTTPLIFQGA